MKASATQNAGLVLSLAVILLTEYQVSVIPVSVYGLLGLLSAFLHHRLYSLVMFETVALLVHVLFMFLYWGRYSAMVMTTELPDKLISALGRDPLPKLTKWYDYEVLEGPVGWIFFTSHKAFLSIAAAIALVPDIWLVSQPGWCISRTPPCVAPAYATLVQVAEPIIFSVLIMIGVFFFVSDNKKKVSPLEDPHEEIRVESSNRNPI